jgi:hypothetical protein
LHPSFSFATIQLSVDHEMAGKGPKIGERPSARSPIFGYSLNFREVLIVNVPRERNPFEPPFRIFWYGWINS